MQTLNIVLQLLTLIFVFLNLESVHFRDWWLLREIFYILFLERYLKATLRLWCLVVFQNIFLCAVPLRLGSQYVLFRREAEVYVLSHEQVFLLDRCGVQR